MEEIVDVINPGEMLLYREGVIYAVIHNRGPVARVNVRFYGNGLWWSWILIAARAAWIQRSYNDAFTAADRAINPEICPDCGGANGHNEGCSALEDIAS